MYNIKIKSEYNLQFRLTKRKRTLGCFKFLMEWKSKTFIEFISNR